MESSKATARHTRQAAGYQPVSQITSWDIGKQLPPGKHKKRKPVVNKQRHLIPRMQKNKCQVSSREILTLTLCTRTLTNAPSVVILLIERDSNGQQKSSSVSHASSLVIIQASVTKEARTSKFPSKQEILRHTNYRQEHCMHKIVPFVANLKIPVQKILSVLT